jgi:hypothetical protein
MPDHYAAADVPSLILTDQHLGASTGPGEPEIGGGIVVARDQITGTPQLDDAGFIFRHGAPDGQQHNEGSKKIAVRTINEARRHEVGAKVVSGAV